MLVMDVRVKLPVKQTPGDFSCRQVVLYLSNIFTIQVPAIQYSSCVPPAVISDIGLLISEVVTHWNACLTGLQSFFLYTTLTTHSHASAVLTAMYNLRKHLHGY